MRNLFGDITEIHDQDHCVAKYTYDAWGNCTAQDLSNPDEDSLHELNPFRYRGYVYDHETGLYYLMSRYYDPQTGRFINADSLEYLDPESINGLNLYSYCYNNPTMYVDPSGHMALWACIAIGAIVGGILGGFTAASKEQDVLTGILTGAVLGAAVGAVIGIGGAVLSGAISSFLGKTVNDLFSVALYGGEFGSWEDYAIAFVFGGLTGSLANVTGAFAGLAKIGKFVADVAARPLANQLVKMGTRGGTFNRRKYMYDVIARSMTHEGSEWISKSNIFGLSIQVDIGKSFYRATLRTLSPSI